MTLLRILVWLVSSATLGAAFILALVIMMTIGMSKSGPSLTEAIVEFWPVGVGVSFAVAAQIINRSRPALALLLSMFGAALLLWFVGSAIPA